MQAYQKEYIDNLKDIAVLNRGRRSFLGSFEEYCAALNGDEELLEQKFKRNMQLLRENLFPVLDLMLEATSEQTRELEEFAGALLNGGDELDIGLFCQIHKALLSVARQKKSRNDTIKELYWLGIGCNNLTSKTVGLDDCYAERYYIQMRLFFTEAAAYIKYYDEIEDVDTRSYILRSRANMSLGKFKRPDEKIRMVKRGLQVLRDEDFHKKNPELPWDKFIYLAHRQMASSMSYKRVSDLTPQNITDIMESVYTVYHKQQQEAAEKNERLPARSQFSCFAIEYYCGLHSLDDLLTKMEQLMDEADPEDFSNEGMYGIISLPAFYCQYLNESPEFVPKRKEYIESLYVKILKYVDDFPEGTQSESLFFYLRQLSYTFLETENSVTYKEFLQKVQIKFAPKIYIHSWLVGRAAEEMCSIITEEEPDFFDDIDFIRDTVDLEEKKKAVRSYAMECGIFHDIGKMNFMNLYSNIARQWFEEEYEMAHLHTLIGMACLAKRPSTQRYVAVAQGHHCWYDGSGGYPESYKRLECPCRQMVDVIGLVDWIINVTDTARLYTGREKTFDEAIEGAITLEGRRFSPLLTARLRDSAVCERIKNAMDEARIEVRRKMYELYGGKTHGENEDA
ncbi:MAG: hypothetical protein NC394_07400 [Bacteroides sp.]|nr:hypothetical protein [Bacteroides sp.]